MVMVTSQPPTSITRCNSRACGESFQQGPPLRHLSALVVYWSGAYAY